MTTTTTTQTSPDFIPRGPVTASLTFYAPPPDNSPPYNYVESPPPGVPQRNYSTPTHTVQINDIRNTEHTHTLDTSAFQALTQIPSAATYTTFDSDADIRDIYYPEVESLLLNHIPGAHRIVIFDHTIRRSSPGAARAPVTLVHIDQTPRSAAQRVRQHVPDEAEAEELLKGRYRIVNVWRALSKTSRAVTATPLAFAASGSVSESDLVAVEHRYPDRKGETAGVKFGDGQKWFYWSGMVGEERLLLKCADSREGVDGVEGRVPHSAFVDPRTPEGAEGRESIEVRALVFG